jgi:glycerol-3-phosphate acyltransferase PlsX
MLVRETYPLLQASGLNFVGNVEGKDIGRSAANVVVTDGLTGNVIVKLTEGVVSFLVGLIKREFTAGVLNKIALLLMIPGLILALPGLALLYPTARRVRKRVDWREVGGAPLLGVNGVVVIGHGRSDVKAIQSMIRMAEKSVQQDLVGAISVALARQEAGKS